MSQNLIQNQAKLTNLRSPPPLFETKKKASNRIKNICSARIRISGHTQLLFPSNGAEFRRRKKKKKQKRGRKMNSVENWSKQTVQIGQCKYFSKITNKETSICSSINRGLFIFRGI